MGKMKGRQNSLILIAALLLGWTLNSLYHVMNAPEKQQSDSGLILQIVVFEMEMLNSTLTEIPNWSHTQQLTVLTQMAYAVDYTHERLLVSQGSEQLAELNGLKRLMDYILRLQIGGDRELKAEEIKGLVESKDLFRQLYEEYAELLASQGSGIEASQRSNIEKIDLSIKDIFSRKLLQ